MPPVYSSNPADDAARLTQAWAARVAANHAQAERVREEADTGDHYQPLAAAFRADPRRRGDGALEALLALTSETDVWLDVGAGAGRFSLPLALHTERVIAVEPSPAMRAELARLQLEHGIFNLDVRDQRWPSDDPALSGIADIALISHVGYDIEPIGAFLDTLDRAARRECVALMFDRSPGSLFWELWPAVHGEPQAQLPGAVEFIALLRARGATVEVGEVPRGADRPRFRFDSPEAALDWARRRLWLAEDSAKLPLLRRAVADLLIAADGGWTLPDSPTHLLIRWRTT